MTRKYYFSTQINQNLLRDFDETIFFKTKPHSKIKGRKNKIAYRYEVINDLIRKYVREANRK